MTLRVITIPGTEAELAVHCTDPNTGTVGCFLFVGSSWRIPGVRCSPVCADLSEMFRWMNDNGWIFHGRRSNYIKT